MRKIASNYIYLPESELLTNSYVILDEEGILESIVNTDGCLREIEKLEFYSGLLVPSYVANNLPPVDTDILFYLSKLYSRLGNNFRGLSLINNIDFLKMKSLSSISVELL